jgi:hypothetical protein
MTSLRIRSFIIVALTGAAVAGPLAGMTQAASPGPSIAGTAGQGHTLTLTRGTWTGTPPNVSDQWTYCTFPDPTTCTSPTGQTGTSYPLGVGDVGKYLAVVETGTDTDPTTMTQITSTATSNVVGPIVGTPANTTVPKITGTTTESQVLTTDTGTWTNTPTAGGYTYQWWRCTSATSCTTPIGADQSTYTLTSADVGDTIEVQVTASNAAGPSAPATSLPTATIVPPAPVNSAAPKIIGTTEVGQTLTEGAGTWTNTPTSIAIQWFHCDSNNANCQPINGATAKPYALTAVDNGATMLVSETATNAGGSTTAYSAASDPVAVLGVVTPPAANPGSVPSVSGAAQLGRALTASGAQFSGFPGTFSYQWLRCNALGCTAIPGATDVTYTPTTADVGDSVVFSETASNTGGASDTVQSSRTDTITAPSTTALQTNASAPVAGQTVTLIATVTSAAGSVKPAGTVDFHAGAAAIPGCTGLALGNSAPTAVCQTSFPASVANLTAAYSAAPGTFITGSTSSPTMLIVGRAATTVTVATSAHVSLGDKTTYTATVHSPAGSSLTPTGRVTFTDKGKRIKGCGSKALAAHGAPCSVKYLGLKQHRIAARYSGDANFAPSASLTSHVLVQPQTPSGFVAVFMNWSFTFKLHATRIASLSASGLSAGIHITVTCRGGGCPFAHRAMTVSAAGRCGKAAKTGCVAGSSFNLTPLFHRAHLRVGTQLTVAITHRGWVGKYYRFTIRKGHKPSIDVSCLAVNGTRPGVGCTAR